MHRTIPRLSARSDRAPFPSLARTIAALFVAAVVWVVACSPNIRQAGGVELVIATNLRIPDDLDTVHVTIAQQLEDGGWLPPVWDTDYPMMTQSDLPLRIAIAAGKSPDQVARIDVAAKLGGRTIVARESQIQVPTDRVAEFVMLLAAKCVDVICLEGNTCDPGSGMCVSSTVDPGQLPPYSPGEPIDAGPIADVTFPPPEAGDGSVMAQPDAGIEAGAGESGSACIPGDTCTPADCQTGRLECTDAGSPHCASTGNVADGTPCGGSGSGEVCHQGACVACAAGTDCTPTGSCEKMQYDCRSGVAVCTAAGNVANGTPCGTSQYCNDGMCQACTAGAGCTPTTNPCNAGKIVCAQGQATCQDQGAAAKDGTQCGTNMVCLNGSCHACVANVTCTPSSNICDKGVTDCSTGVQTCPGPGMPDPVQNGKTCATGSVCDNGACNACPQGQDCRPAGTCAVMVDVCTSGAPVCTAGTGSVPDGASCGGGNTCCSGGCVDTQTDSSNCGTCGHVCGSGTECVGGSCTCDSRTCPSGCCSSSNTCLPAGSNQQNSGSCGTLGNQCVACTSNESCINGGCACPSGTLNDSNNCGTCGHACAAGTTCVGGQCACTTASCPNGCCTPQGTCNTSVGACGTLGGNCANCSTGAGGTVTSGTCNGVGQCVITACALREAAVTSGGVCARHGANYLMDCDGIWSNGCETDPSGTANCGACGFSCPATIVTDGGVPKQVVCGETPGTSNSFDAPCETGSPSTPPTPQCGLAYHCGYGTGC